MPSETSKLTIRLPRQDIEFVKAYARTHGLTVTEVIDRHLRHMRSLDMHSPTPALDSITGRVPTDVDVAAEFRRHAIEKHGRDPG